jgi:hypothetical protein
MSTCEPVERIVALNVDDNVLCNIGVRGFEGLICDHHDEFLYGRYGRGDGSCIIHAEILNILKHKLN